MQRPDILRRTSRAVRVGLLALGGEAPVRVQSMTDTRTADVEATLGQVRALAGAGAELVRVATPTPEDTAALRAIVAGSPVPIVADVHFHFARALEAIDAGVAKLRLNPGNLADRGEVREVIAAARSAGVVLRVGVNEGSIVERRDRARHDADLARPIVDLMVEKLADYLDVFAEEHFEDLVLSAKSADAVTTIAVNRELARRWNYPLHLGVTHAGTARTGAIRSAAALGALLAEGIGETVRISYAGDPLREVRAAVELLACLRLRERTGVELIACPGCGRMQTDLTPILEALEDELDAFARQPRCLSVAVMGCVVNGPGEAEHADLAVCAGAGKAAIYRKGQFLRTVAEADILPALLEEIRHAFDAAD